MTARRGPETTRNPETTPVKRNRLSKALRIKQGPQVPDGAAMFIDSYFDHSSGHANVSQPVPLNRRGFCITRAFGTVTCGPFVSIMKRCWNFHITIPTSLPPYKAL
ncbi:hypothetical protein NDU88_005811 [Pleurodeles waltl]|uniref:Uncharacterized protein n=1 Tax=Pleurodeles waltl TaxID=8319 RepID=A0AAV7LM68_PLEWA|nr:hypothetical protein NDU88_005811 [Pleurodeles waltl]